MPPIKKTAKAQPGTPILPSAFILVGGRGTRLGTLCSDCPKPMLPVAGRPFLDTLVQCLYRQGARHFVFLTGYKGDRVESYFGDNALPGARYDYVREKRPLGTGGAIAAALTRCRAAGQIVVVNGDSMVPFQLSSLIRAARARDGAVLAVKIADTARFGTLEVDKSGHLASFREKACVARSGLINAGIYCLSTSLFAVPPRKARFSIEKESFPQWLAAGRRFKVVSVKGPFLDIGTPESLAAAELFVKRFCQTA